MSASENRDKLAAGTPTESLAMDLNRLSYFCRVAELGSLTAAARTLGLTPAALSKSLRVLERELGLALITPAGRGIAITPAGQKLAEQAAPLVTQARRLLESLPTENETHSLKLGAAEPFTGYFLPHIAAQALQPRPISILELTAGQLEYAIVKGDVDLGLTYNPVALQGLRIEALGNFELAIFAHPKLVARHSRLTADGFPALPFACPPDPARETHGSVTALDGWPFPSLRRTARYRAELMQTALELCRLELACAFLPDFVVKLYNAPLDSRHHLKRLRTAFPTHVSRTIHLVTRESEPEGALHRAIARAVREVLRE